MLVFGGYDGTNRLNDLLEFKFGADLMSCHIPPSTLVEDLQGIVNDEVGDAPCLKLLLLR
jgi:leucine-zipper-like transcriptional regulator 1